MSVENALSAFAVSAGISPDKMSLAIRTLLLTMTFVWAAWCVYGELHHLRHHDSEVFDFIRKTSRILIIVTLMVALVFIP